MKYNAKRILYLSSITLVFLVFAGVLSSCRISWDIKDIDKETTSETTLETETIIENANSPLSYLNEALDGPYEVEYVIDGDTIIVTINDESVHVRLIGIDTPECASHDETLNTPEGIVARERTLSLIESSNSEVYLEYDEERYDSYGRLLAYVYIEDYSHQYSTRDFTMIEEILLKENMGEVLTINPNNRYAEFFEEISNN